MKIWGEKCKKKKKNNEKYVFKANKGQKMIIFKLDDWVWVHM